MDRWKTLFCAVSILVLTACAAERTAVAPPAPIPDYAAERAAARARENELVQAEAAQLNGADLFYDHCSRCHTGEVGVKAHTPHTLSTFTKERIVSALTAGMMYSQGQNLTPAQRQAIANFLVDDKAGEETP